MKKIIRDMRRMRFSLKRLLVLTALVAACLYGLILLPPAHARRFAENIKDEVQRNRVVASEAYFQGMQISDESAIEIEYSARNLTDYWMFRQPFKVQLVTPGKSPKEKFIT